MKKTILLFAVAALAFASCGKENVNPGPEPDGTLGLNCVKPDYLVAGDTVALISPSYYTPMENVEATADLLRSWGLVPVIGPNVGKEADGKYAGTVAERTADILWAFNDPSIKAVICNRGGYGSIQLIGQIPLAELSASPKWLVGFSDICTLHGLLNRAGVMSIHGPMSTFLAAGGSGESSTMMRDLLMGQIPCYYLPAHPANIAGVASGVLVGGNLCTIAPNVGSQADATMAQDIILFIEEVGEPMRNIDRQLRILQMNGVLDRCKGVVLGEFDGCGSEFTYESVEAMIRQMVEPYGIPMLCGFPAGHGDVNLPLVMGAPVTIDVRVDGATLQFDIAGEQRIVYTTNVIATPTPIADRMQRAGKRL
ncbi:MAG: LD-carboxypeptidase [Bacteroidales bacterium]|nr:LD-carboxypeptidase [Bacteroidales bacterium]